MSCHSRHLKHADSLVCKSLVEKLPVQHSVLLQVRILATVSPYSLYVPRNFPDETILVLAAVARSSRTATDVTFDYHLISIHT